LKTIYLPKPEELAYNLNKIPQSPNEYKLAIKSLANSVIDYSKQIEELFFMEESITEEKKEE